MHPSRTITKCHLRRNSVNHLISSTNVETTYRRRKPHKRGVRRLGLSWFLFFCEVSKRRFKIEQRCCLLEAAGAYWLVQLASLLLMGDTCQQRPARSEQSVRNLQTNFRRLPRSVRLMCVLFCVDEPAVMGKYVSAS